jgi:hypothetical protein
MPYPDPTGTSSCTDPVPQTPIPMLHLEQAGKSSSAATHQDGFAMERLLSSRMSRTHTSKD